MMNDGDSGEVVGFVEHVISVPDKLKTLIFYVINLLGAFIYGYRLIHKFIWGRREAKEYLITLREIERNYGQVAGIAKVLQSKSALGNVDPEDMIKLEAKLQQLGQLIRKLPVDVKDPSRVELPKVPPDEYEVARKEVVAWVLLENLFYLIGYVCGRTTREIERFRWFVERSEYI